MLYQIKSITSVALGWLLALSLFTPMPTLAMPLPQGKSFQYLANKEPLTDFLRNYASAQSLPIKISDKVSGVVNGQFSGSSIKKFLDDISQVFGLIWYYDGSVIHVYNSNEIQTKVVRVDGLDVSRLKGAMQELGVSDQRYSWRQVPGQKLIYVSGPPRFVELVDQVAQIQTTERQEIKQQTTNVRIFRLRYALAYDRSYQSRGETIVVKGLGTVLRDILGQQTNKSRGDVKSYNMPHAKSSQGDKAVTDEKAIANAESMLADLPAEQLNGRITSDRRLNAVVINDSPEKMPMYKALIDTLDVPSEQVEISVSIMDISTDQLAELGFDWANAGKDGQVQFGSKSSDLLPAGGASGAYGVQTIVAHKAGEFLAKIKMLSEQGNAQIFSRPVVLTKDMEEAVIDNSNTFYVRIAGKEDVQLFPITYGTLMRVTPRIVDEQETRWIHMDINIEDGHKSGEPEVDAIPTVKKTSINTQSMIPNGDSLLIGGYIYSAESSLSSGVPFLEDIPILGYFFSWDSEDSRQWVRLFMISPRTVTRSDMLGNNQDHLKSIYQKRMVKKFAPHLGSDAKIKSQRQMTKKRVPATNKGQTKESSDGLASKNKTRKSR